MTNAMFGKSALLAIATDSAQGHEMADSVAVKFMVSAHNVSVDMRDGDACYQLIADVGHRDILVNNAGGEALGAD